MRRKVFGEFFSEEKYSGQRKGHNKRKGYKHMHNNETKANKPENLKTSYTHKKKTDSSCVTFRKRNKLKLL